MTLGDRIVLMDRGVIQQVDAPLAIYQWPANQFVASFIGSPAMNFIRGQIENGVFRFAVNGNGTAEVNPAAHGGIEVGNAVPNGPAMLGVRPEDLIGAATTTNSEQSRLMSWSTWDMKQWRILRWREINT